MDLKEQKYVCTLAECKSLTRASERLYISQPALSLYINNVEKNLWRDRIFEKCGIGRDEGGDGGKTLEIRGKRRLSARDGGANYQQS